MVRLMEVSIKEMQLLLVGEEEIKDILNLSPELWKLYQQYKNSEFYELRESIQENINKY